MGPCGRQGHKVRNMDDLSEFSVNQCYGPGEKLDLGGVDEVVSLAAAWMRVHGHRDEGVRVQASCWRGLKRRS